MLERGEFSIEAFSGIDPEARLVVEDELPREWVKNQLLREMPGISSKVVVSPRELAREIIEISWKSGNYKHASAEELRVVLSPDAELKPWILSQWIREGWKETRGRQKFYEPLLHLRFQKEILCKKLAREILKARLLLASDEEVFIQKQILSDAFRRGQGMEEAVYTRQEACFDLFVFYSQMIAYHPQVWDAAKVFSMATTILENGGKCPKVIWSDSSALTRLPPRVNIFRQACLELPRLETNGTDEEFGQSKKSFAPVGFFQNHADSDLLWNVQKSQFADLQNEKNPVVILGPQCDPALERLMRFPGDSLPFAVPLRDTRDPQRFQRAESFKAQLFCFEIVASRYSRENIEYLVNHFLLKGMQNDKSATSLDTVRKGEGIIRRIRESGIRNGFNEFRNLAERNLIPSFGEIGRQILVTLEELEANLGGRRTGESMAAYHINWLSTHSELLETDVTEWKAHWKKFIRLSQAHGIYQKSARASEWLERFNAFLENESVTQSTEWIPSWGKEIHQLGAYLARKKWLRWYRSHFASAHFASRAASTVETNSAPFEHDSVYLIGFSSDDFFGQPKQELIYSPAIRNRLGLDFEIFGQRQEAEIFRTQLKSLFDLEGVSVSIWESKYGLEGKERTSTLADWSAFLPNEIQPQFCPPAPWTIASAGGPAYQPTRDISLSPWPTEKLSVTNLDHYSRCFFRGVASSRWKLKTSDEPSEELWSTERGRWLHLAVGILLLDAESSAREALDAAWIILEDSLRGWIPHSGVKQAEFLKLEKILEKFLEKEKGYQEISKSKLLALDGMQGAVPESVMSRLSKEMRARLEKFSQVPMPELEVQLAGVSIVGRPDRIDLVGEATPDAQKALFIIDFKSSNQNLPAVSEGLESGYRVQLPLYALAAKKHYGLPVWGAQLVELSSSGSRGSGIFFSFVNGKEPGCLTQARKNQKALYPLRQNEVDDFWNRYETVIAELVTEIKRGIANIAPKNPEIDCETCPYDRLCGRGRWKQKVDLEIQNDQKGGEANASHP